MAIKYKYHLCTGTGNCNPQKGEIINARGYDDAFEKIAILPDVKDDDEIHVFLFDTYYKQMVSTGYFGVAKTWKYPDGFTR